MQSEGKNVKIVVLGGAGDMGSRAVEDLAGSEGVEKVTIADRNLAAAESLAARLRGRKAEVVAKAVDGDDHDALVAVMRGHDVAASALGPFHRFETKLARAAIDAGIDYASICDDWDAAEAVFRDLGGLARERGRIVLTGLGASPGISNVGLRFLSRGLDSVRRADISVYQPLDAGGGEAVVRHMLHIMTGEIALWRGGRRVLVPAVSETRVVEFPKFGSVRLWNMGHAEPVTVPLFFPGIDEVNFFMGYGRGARLLVTPARLGLFRSRTAVEATVKLLLAIDRMTSSGTPGKGAVRLDLWGKTGGREEHRLGCGIGEMREATGLCLSVGTLMLARKHLTTKEGGVYAPEACLDPEPFVREIRAKGIETYADLAMTIPLA